MENVLKLTKNPEFKRKNSFTKIEKKNSRTIYHTKIMMDIYKFGANEKKNRFRLSLRNLSYGMIFVEEIPLFSIKEGDRFIGIFYGYRKPAKKILINYEVNGIKKIYSISKEYYMEFKFKKGSILCYFRGLFYLLKKKKINSRYNKSLFKTFTLLEKQVYEFYGKKYPEKGPLIKWIEKNWTKNLTL